MTRHLLFKFICHLSTQAPTSCHVCWDLPFFSCLLAHNPLTIRNYFKTSYYFIPSDLILFYFTLSHSNQQRLHTWAPTPPAPGDLTANIFVTSAFLRSLLGPIENGQRTTQNVTRPTGTVVPNVTRCLQSQFTQLNN